MAVPQRQYRQPWPTSAARNSFAERTDFSHQYSLLPVEKFIGGVIDTGEQFIAVLFTPVNNLSPVSKTPAITFFPGVVDTGQKIYRRCQRHC
jgi:hypothetical protein